METPVEYTVNESMDYWKAVHKEQQAALAEATARIADLEREVARLQAAQWQPVEPGYNYTDKCDHTVSVYAPLADSMDITDDTLGYGISIKLPPNVRICRRVDPAD